VLVHNPKAPNTMIRVNKWKEQIIPKKK
jgi:hypothetical protein